MAPLHRIIDAWSHRSTRERHLACAVGMLLCTLIALVALKGAFQYLYSLDREIIQLSDQVLNNARMLALRDRVDARFAEVANQHSSAWTESEIRDRLRQEIYRLSNRVPPGLDAHGIPLSTTNDSGVLVEVPELGSGRLVEGGEGYRAYQMEFAVPPVALLDLTAYLERLMESPQSLRIDRIDLRRDPGRAEFAANLVITRTVVDNPGIDANRAQGTDVHLLASDWICEDSEARVEGPTPETQLLVLQGRSTGGRAFFERALPATGVFDVTLELASTSDGQIGVLANGSPLVPSGDTTIRGDGRFYRYRFQFALPGGGGDRVTTGCPLLTWNQPDAVLRIRRLQLSRVEGAAHGN